MAEPRWLGYLDVALKWCEAAERSNKILTHALMPQFAELLASGQAPAQQSLHHILDNGLTWQNLEGIECALLFGKIIKRPVVSTGKKYSRGNFAACVQAQLDLKAMPEYQPPLLLCTMCW